MKIEPLRWFHIQEMPQPVEWKEDNPLIQEVRRIQAIAVERAAMELDNEICRASIEAAREAGITDLYLLDKQFIAEAIREKMERMKTDETAESEAPLP